MDRLGERRSTCLVTIIIINDNLVVDPDFGATRSYKYLYDISCAIVRIWDEIRYYFI